MASGSRTGSGSGSGFGVGSSSSNIGTGYGISGGGPGGATIAVQLLNATRVIPPNDDEKKPLWRYYTEVWINEVPGRQAPHMDQEISEERNKCFRRLNPGRAEDLVFVHQNLRLISRKSPKYVRGPSRFWDIGGDNHEVFAGGADFLQQAELSLDELDLEILLDDIGALDIGDEDQQIEC